MTHDTESTPAVTSTFADTLAIWVATGAYTGFSPILPGTVGCLLGLPLAWGIGLLPGLGLQIALILGLGLMGVPLCTRAARLLGKKDPGSIVWDEIASLPIVFLGFDAAHPTTLALGFFLHRVFDITKPPPARQLERLPEGLGIMADDWIAALYAQLGLRLLWWSGWLG